MARDEVSWGGRYRAASWFRESATEMFRAWKKTVKGT